MKILLVITDLGMGGAEQQVCALVDQYVKNGHQVEIVSLTGESVLKPVSENVLIREMKMRKTPLGFFNAYKKIKKALRNFNPDVVHSHMFHANLMMRLVRLQAKMRRLVCTAHSNNEGGKLRMLLYRWTNFLSDFNTNVSQDAVDTFVRKGAFKEGEIQAVVNGIDVQKFQKQKDLDYLKRELGIALDNFVFIAVGRLTDAKDYPNLLRAFQILQSEKDGVYLVIVGAGELELELIKIVSELKIDESVYFLGLRRDIPQLLNGADTFVLSSWYEGLPLVLGEAMACEKLVVATDCGGVKQVVGNNGILVLSKNSEKLAGGMLKAINLTKEERNNIGFRARKYIMDNFSIDSVSRKWLKIYEAKKNSFNK